MKFEAKYIGWLTEKAMPVFEESLDDMLKLVSDYEIERPEIYIRNMKSRWGSCTPARNTITLNKKLIHYPLEFIEYVVLHEFVHFIQPNHSKAFYNIIENYMPDYKQRMQLIA